VELISGLIAWFTDPANWSGRDAITVRLLEHVVISAAGVTIGLLVALPVGLYIGHTGRGAFLAISLANVGRAVPSYAVLVIFFAFLVGSSSDINVVTNGPTLVAMVALAIPPVVTNAYAGLRDVDRDLVEAGRAMGMREAELLRRIELPLALPVILAGIRTASIQVVATAALGAVIGGGGLGRYIIQGITRFDNSRLLAGALMVALLAIGTELVLASVQRRATSPGTRRDGSDPYEIAGQSPVTAGVPR
jgi:osmoprotectant transport system permease protein